MKHLALPGKPIRRTTILALLLTGCLTTVGAGTLLASPPGGQGGPRPQAKEMQEPDQATIEAMEKFMEQTKVLRKEMAQKHASMRALMQSENPDQAKAAQLAGELFDLREQIRGKAKEAGIRNPRLLGMGGHGRHPGMIGLADDVE